jgi:hypothetical protein
MALRMNAYRAFGARRVMPFFDSAILIVFDFKAA